MGPQPSAARPAHDPGATVLLVDDNPGTLDTLSAYLKLEGYVVYTASNGEQAIELLRTTALSIVVVDLRMPEVDGIAVRHAQRSSALAAIPFVLMSAAPDGARVAAELHADGFIAKPFDVEELLVIIDDIVAKHAVTKAS
jgi:two-component system cell cycle response regulator